MTAMVLDKVTHRAGSATLLREVSCTIEPAQFTALLGPNGAGKTTLLNILSGQTRPSTGFATLYGKKIWQWKAAELAKIRAVMPQHSSVSFHYTAEEIVALGRYPHRFRPLPNEANIPFLALQAVGIQAYANRYYNSLSGGEKARVQFARALAQIWQNHPQIDTPTPKGKGAKKGVNKTNKEQPAGCWLLLDEPTAALDWKYQLQIMQIAKNWSTNKGVGVVAIVHDLNLALRYADRVLVLEQGKLVAAGKTEETLTPKTVEKTWQVQCEKAQRKCGSPHLIL